MEFSAFVRNVSLLRKKRLSNHVCFVVVRFETSFSWFVAALSNIVVWILINRSNVPTNKQKKNEKPVRIEARTEIIFRDSITWLNICLRMKIWQIFNLNWGLLEKFTDKMNKNTRFKTFLYYLQSFNTTQQTRKKRTPNIFTGIYKCFFFQINWIFWRIERRKRPTPTPTTNWSLMSD